MSDSVEQPSEASASEGFVGWAIVELMGHRVVAGHVSPHRLAGIDMIKVDIPWFDPTKGTRISQFYNGKSIYCLTVATEEEARREAACHEPQPRPATDEELPW